MASSAGNTVLLCFGVHVGDRQVGIHRNEGVGHRLDDIRPEVHVCEVKLVLRRPLQCQTDQLGQEIEASQLERREDLRLGPADADCSEGGPCRGVERNGGSRAQARLFDLTEQLGVAGADLVG